MQSENPVKIEVDDIVEHNGVLFRVSSFNVTSLGIYFRLHRVGTTPIKWVMKDDKLVPANPSHFDFLKD